MSELIRQSRYQFLLSSLESEHQRLALQEEYKFFTTTDPNRVPVPDDMTADQLTNHFKYSVAGLNAEAVYKSVTHELAHAFSWKIAVAGEDYWDHVWHEYESARRIAAAAAIKEVKERTKKLNGRAEGDRLAKAAFDLKLKVESDTKEFNEDNAERAKREAVHESNKIHILHARKELLESEPECDPPSDS